MARRRRLTGHYTQFRGLSEQEVNAGLRAEASRRRAQELSRVEPLHLDRTTWPEVPHPAVVGAVTYAARRALHRHPDRVAGELRSEIAHRHGLEPTRTVVGAGASQLLRSALASLLAPGDELICPWPGYGLYPAAARRLRAVAVPVERGHDPDALLAALTPRTRVVCLANPNDPTGELLDAAGLRRLLEAIPDRVAVVVDEALREFVVDEPADATVGLLEEHPRLLLVRTFSKAWGLAGLRCGYALGGPGAQELLEGLAPDHGVGELAHAGCVEALRHHAELPALRADRLAPIRARLMAELDERGFATTRSAANVVWAHAGGDGALPAALARARIHVAGGAAWGAADRVRITVPHVEADLERLLRALG